MACRGHRWSGATTTLAGSRLRPSESSAWTIGVSSARSAPRPTPDRASAAVRREPSAARGVWPVRWNSRCWALPRAFTGSPRLGLANSGRNRIARRTHQARTPRRSPLPRACPSREWVLFDQSDPAIGTGVSTAGGYCHLRDGRNRTPPVAWLSGQEPSTCPASVGVSASCADLGVVDEVARHLDDDDDGLGDDLARARPVSSGCPGSNVTRGGEPRTGRTVSRHRSRPCTAGLVDAEWLSAPRLT